jgi:hypothetical protein
MTFHAGEKNSDHSPKAHRKLEARKLLENAAEFPPSAARCVGQTQWSERVCQQLNTDQRFSTHGNKPRISDLAENNLSAHLRSFCPTH